MIKVVSLFLQFLDTDSHWKMLVQFLNRAFTISVCCLRFTNVPTVPSGRRLRLGSTSTLSATWTRSLLSARCAATAPTGAGTSPSTSGSRPCVTARTSAPRCSWQTRPGVATTPSTTSTSPWCGCMSPTPRAEACPRARRWVEIIGLNMYLSLLYLVKIVEPSTPYTPVAYGTSDISRYTTGPC